MQKRITMHHDDDLKSEDQEHLSNSNSLPCLVSPLTSLDGLPTKPQTEPRKHGIEEVFAAEAMMLKQPQVELPVRHFFAPGVYARELTIYAGVMLTGAVHRYEQLNILSQGSMRVLIDGTFVDVSAPFTVVSPPGTKRIAIAVTDCVWTTILGTDETDPEVIEKHFTIKTEKEYLEWRSLYLPS